MSGPPVLSTFPVCTLGIDFAELAADQMSRPDVLRLQKSPTLLLIMVSVGSGFSKI